MAGKAGKEDKERAMFFQGLNEAVWMDFFSDVRKEGRMHQQDKFARQFEQLPSRREKMDDVVRRRTIPGHLHPQ